MSPGADSFWVCFRLSLDPVTTVTDSGRDRMNTHARSGPILRRTRVSTLIPRPPVGLLRTSSTVTSAPGDMAFDGGIFHCGYFKLRHGPESTPLRGIWFFRVYLPPSAPEPALSPPRRGFAPAFGAYLGIFILLRNARCPRFTAVSGDNLGFQSHPVGRKSLSQPFKAG